MAIELIDLGTIAQDGADGDLAREAFLKVNSNFSELDTRVTSNTQDIANLGTSKEWVLTPGTGISIDRSNPAIPVISSTGSTSSGDVNGPATSVDSEVVLFDGVTGKVIKGGGVLGTAAFTSTSDYATSAQGVLADSAVQANQLSTVATTGSYPDLSNRPILGTAAAAAVGDFATASQGALAASAVQPEDLALVATTGVYADLTGKPVLGSAAATSSADYATAVQGLKADSAVQPNDLNGYERSLTPGLNITIDRTNPLAPVISSTAAGGGGGDIIGPAAATSNAVAIFDGTTGKLLKDGGVLGSAAFDETADFATAAQGTLADTATQPGDLASVATSGAYTDLSGLPTLGTAAATNSTDYATAAQGVKADSAVQPAALADKLNRVNPVVEGSITEEVFALTGTAPVLEPDNGTIQTWTLTGNSTPTDGFSAGQSMTLMIDDGTGYTITWPSVVWVGGTAPVLAATGRTVVELWKVGTVLYGALVGSVA